ncbi:DUF1542 domain-containing protein, partial [Streptococcus suis]|uniref:DUF1542 domain-containing protein n=2 Tax=Streptococcus suis TaxID=1307 RepID=UPI002FCA5E61
MNRSKKKSFDWYGARQRFSIRKYHIGAASVLLGTTLVLGTGTIVGAETGVNGDGASNGQIVPGNDAGTSNGTQPQGDNQGVNSSGVQTGNTTNSTANVQPAGDTGSASSQPVGTSRSADTGTQGDGSTNQPVDEPVIKFPTTVNDPVPEGYVLVAFIKPEYGAKYVFEGLQGEFSNAPAQLIERRKLQLEVRFWVKEGTTWGQLFETPEWRWPKINPVSGDVFIDWNYGYGNSNRFDSNKMKDQLVTTSYFIPMLNYEVEEIEPSNASVEAFLAWYSPEGRSKWFIVSFDAGQGSMTYKSKQYTSRSVAVYYQNIGYDNNQFTSKVVSPTLDGHTFVRWQTEDGKVLPTTGTITSTEVYKALYLAHPQNKVAVFDSTKLTDSEKEQVKQKIYDANPNLSTGVPQVIKAIEISATGEATVTFDDGTAVKVPSATLTNEDKATARSNAKAEIEKDAMEKSAAINASNLTEEEKRARLTEVRDAQDRANIAIDNAATTEELTKALEDGTAAIKAVSTTNTIKTKAKEALEEAYNAKKDAITNSGLTAEEKDAKQAELDKAKEDADKAIDAATDNAGVDTALEAGKTAIAGIDTSTSPKKAAAKEELKAAAEDAKKAIDANDNLTDAEKQAAKDAVDAEVAKAEKAIDAATKADEVDAATLAGTKAITEDVVDAAKQDAKNKIAEDVKAAKEAIDNNPNLSEDEKQTFKDAVDEATQTAKGEIDKATTPEAAQTLEDAAVKDLANIEIKAAYDDAVKAIEAADNLSTAAKTQALEDLKKARQAAEEAIKTASTADEVAKGALDGLKSLAKVEATAAADDAKAAIAQNSNLTDAEKKVYTDAIGEALKDTETKIDAATDADTVDAETVLAQKDIAKQEVAAATADAVKGIEANTNLTDAEKDEYKATVTKAAETAEKAIADATTAADIQSKTFDATQDVAKEEVKADAADAIAGIKANDNLSDTAKEEAIAAIEEARNTTLENIENAKTA